ncbi:uncharacterized protein NPIL_149371 [Nephila pilipes]|uniref:Uncharacterized protein n=1 Tax=Nephila pilipes TaxID=299642 RepID=A0A8X6PFM6_NEPPI|nr:uncharacterized protein NPIL_149371 [Nephila pilipes]
MIESSIIGSSVWDSDPYQEYNTIGLSSHFNFSCDNDIAGNSYWSGYSTPNDASSCSSDYDGLTFGEFDAFFEISDSFVSEILDNNPTSFSNLDLLNLTESPEKDNYKPISNFNPDSPVYRNALEYLLTSKLWSHMSSDEQLNILHALSEVTCHMGLREQMEVIKIIDPTAVISPEDKEFALDGSNLNDVKLQRVRDIISKQKHTLLQKSSKSLNSSSSLSSKKTNNSSKFVSRKNNASYTRTKRKSQKEEQKQNIIFPAEEKQIKLKRQKQTRKEQKSGFFVYEKRMVIDSVLEDEDINILE